MCIYIYIYICVCASRTLQVVLARVSEFVLHLASLFFESDMLAEINAAHIPQYNAKFRMPRSHISKL